MIQRHRFPRSTCCVFGCRRTSTKYRGEWVCGPHYRLVDTALKRTRIRLRARHRKAFAAAQRAADGPAVERICSAWDRMENAVWRRMMRQATERALGISA